MSRLKAVFFDGYGTLLHVADPFARMQAALAAAGVSVPKPAMAAALNDEMAWYVSHCHRARDEASLRRLGEECVAVFLAGLQRERVAHSLSVATTLAALLESFRFELFADASPVLTALREMGLRTGVISNWDFRLPRILSELGVGEQIDFVLTSATEAAPKPSTAMFSKAMRLADVRPAEAWHVGDKVDHDVEPARSCGLQAILLVRDPEIRPATQPAIRSLSELVPLARAAL